MRHSCWLSCVVFAALLAAVACGQASGPAAEATGGKPTTPQGGAALGGQMSTAGSPASAGVSAGGESGGGQPGSAGHSGQDNGPGGGAGAGAGGAGTGGASGGSDGGAGAGGSGSPRPPVTAAPGAKLVKLNPALRQQKFEGWGTSLCWWARNVGGWATDKRNALVDLVADPINGLGYNIFRYNIGGGENPAHTHMDTFKDMPGFEKENGTFDWNADAEQRAVLLRLAELHADLIVEAFSNSPPYWMTTSGCASGNSDG